MISIDIVIPCYNSSQSVREVVAQVNDYFLKHEGYRHNIILVNDFSQDDTLDQLLILNKTYDNITVVDLAKNAGQHNAILAGLSLSESDLALCCEDDLQTPVEEIGKLLQKMHDGYDIVYGVYEKKQHTLWQNFGSKVNDLTVNHFLEREKGLRASGFWVAKKFVVQKMVEYNSPETNIQGLFLRLGKVGNVVVNHHKRQYGSSNYTLKKHLKIWASFLNYTRKIQLLPFYFSLFLFLLTVVFVVLLAVKKLQIFAIVGIISLIGSMLMLVLGFIGVYVFRAFEVVTNSPQYVIKNIYRNQTNE